MRDDGAVEVAEYLDSVASHQQVGREVLQGPFLAWSDDRGDVSGGEHPEISDHAVQRAIQRDDADFRSVKSAESCGSRCDAVREIAVAHPDAVADQRRGVAVLPQRVHEPDRGAVKRLRHARILTGRTTPPTDVQGRLA